MPFAEKEFGQVRLTTTSATSIYSPGSGVTGIIVQVTICNTSSSAVVWSLYQDNDGSTYSENTALHFEQPIAAKTTIEKKVWQPMSNENGNIAAQSSLSNALTVTVYGTERS
jgi:hypothetical protein